MTKYFAFRKWVALSISYRLRSQKGTLPHEWVDNAPKIAFSKAENLKSI